MARRRPRDAPGAARGVAAAVALVVLAGLCIPAAFTLVELANPSLRVDGSAASPQSTPTAPGHPSPIRVTVPALVSGPTPVSGPTVSGPTVSGPTTGSGSTTGSGRATPPLRSLAPSHRPKLNSHLPRARRGTVYLTFDDGPSTFTPAILRILTEQHATATFFELGIRQQSLPGMAARVRRQGSNIGNHTYDHKKLTELSVADIRAELRGGPRSRCVRPPYGATNVEIRRLISAVGAREVMWTVDTRDWSRPGVATIVTRATGTDIGTGSIILMHDGGGPREETVAALPIVIATLQQRGFHLSRLPAC